MMVPKEQITRENTSKQSQKTLERGQKAEDKSKMEVLVHAIEGAPGNKTITLTGRKGKHEFSTLVDGESTHRFIDETTAVRQTTPMEILVANENHLTSLHECTEFGWKV